MTIVQMHPMSASHASEEKKMKKTRRRRKKVVKASAPTITEERRNMIKGKAKVKKNEKVTVTKSAETDSRDVKTKEELHDLHHRRTLFVRFPYRVKDKSVVNKLHHGIETVRFKHRIDNWCHVRFVSEEVAKMALKKLHNMKLEKGGKLFVAETKKGKINKITSGNKEEKDQKEKKLRLFKIFVKDLPESVTKAEIRSAFPKCAKIRILPANIKKKSQTALVGFRNVNDMKAVVAERIHRVRDKEVHVDYSKSYLNLSNQELQKNTSSKTAKISTPLVSTRKQNALVTPKSLGKMVEASLSQLKKRDNVAKETQMDTSENITDSDSMGDESENEGINMVDVRSKTNEKLRTANAGNYSKPKGRGNINIGQDDESDYEFNDTDDDTHNQSGGSGDSNDSGDGDDSSDNNDGEGSEDSNDDSNDESVDDDDDDDDDDDNDDDVGSGDNDSSDEGSANEDDGSDDGGDEDEGSSGDSKDADVKDVK